MAVPTIARPASLVVTGPVGTACGAAMSKLSPDPV